MKNFSRSLRFLFWYLGAFVGKHGWILFFGFITGFLLFLLLVKTYPVLIVPLPGRQTKRIAVVGTYNPTTLPPYIQNLISVGLTTLDETGSATSSISTRWEIREDGKVYIFYFKRRFLWHDGTAFSVDDINYNLRDAKLEPVSEEILKITLNEPFSPLPSTLARPIFKRGLVGLGPYKVKKLKLKGDRLLSLSLTPVMSDLPQLEFKFYPTEAIAITAFKLGEIDILDKISQSNDFSSWPAVSVTTKTYFNYNIILFFNTRLPFLQKKTVRQALAYSLPTFPEEKSLGPLNPRSWAYNPHVKTYTQNLDMAKNILAKENQATNAASLVISTFSSFLSYASSMASLWESLGIKTSVKIENTLPTSFDVLLVSQEVPADPDQYYLWHSTQPTNISGFSSLKIDKLLEDGRRIVDKDKRFKIYQDFQRYLVEEVPAVFLYHPKLYQIERK